MHELINYNKFIRDLIILCTDIDPNNVRQVGQKIEIASNTDIILFNISSFKTFQDPFKRGAYYSKLINPTFSISAYGENSFSRACDIITNINSLKVSQLAHSRSIGIGRTSDIIIINDYIGENPIKRCDFTLQVNGIIEKVNDEFLEKFEVNVNSID